MNSVPLAPDHEIQVSDKPFTKRFQDNLAVDVDDPIEYYELAAPNTPSFVSNLDGSFFERDPGTGSSWNLLKSSSSSSLFQGSSVHLLQSNLSVRCTGFFFALLIFLLFGAGLVLYDSMSTNVVVPNIPGFGALSDEAKQGLFNDFTEKYRKSYPPVERDYRLTVFKQNLNVIDELNAAEKVKGTSATFKITKFTDLTELEFRTQYLTLKIPQTLLQERNISALSLNALTGNASVRSTRSTGILYDWSGIYTNVVRDQGDCGSCWAFSVVSQIESDAIRSNQLTLGATLSVQQIINCDSKDRGCKGGWVSAAYDYLLLPNLGIAFDNLYPYTSGDTGVEGTCPLNGLVNSIALNSYTFLTKSSRQPTAEVAMRSYITSTGPLSICVDASSWLFYGSGILTGFTAVPNLNHAAQLVGINERNSTNIYWIVSSPPALSFIPPQYSTRSITK